MLLGDDYFSQDEESTDLLETDDEDEGNRNSHSESSESSEPSDDFPKFIYLGRERDEANHGNTSCEGEGSFQMTDDSDVQSETKTNLQFSIKKNPGKKVSNWRTELSEMRADKKKCFHGRTFAEKSRTISCLHFLSCTKTATEHVGLCQMYPSKYTRIRNTITWTCSFR